MSDLLTWVWNVYYFIDGISWLFGVIAVGFIGVVVGLRKLMVYFWPDLDTPLNKKLRAAKFVDPCPFADPRGSSAQVRAWEKLQQNEESRD